MGVYADFGDQSLSPRLSVIQWGCRDESDSVVQTRGKEAMKRLPLVMLVLLAGSMFFPGRTALAQLTIRGSGLGRGTPSLSSGSSRSGFNTRQAKRKPRAYVPPARLSPWLNLNRNDGGILDNYHTFVQPEIQLRKTLTQQKHQLQQQGTSIRALGQQMTDFKRESTARPTGTGSVFMNYSHYFAVPRRSGSRR